MCEMRRSHLPYGWLQGAVPVWCDAQEEVIDCTFMQTDTPFNSRRASRRSWKRDICLRVRMARGTMLNDVPNAVSDRDAA